MTIEPASEPALPTPDADGTFEAIDALVRAVHALRDAADKRPHRLAKSFSSVEPHNELVARAWSRLERQVEARVAAARSAVESEVRAQCALAAREPNERGCGDVPR